MNPLVHPLLNELECVLKQHGLWSAQRPAETRLASQVPFAVDSLTFCEWLQFIFLPTLRAMSEQGQALPDMHVAPAAEVYLPQQVESGSDELIATLKQLDALAS